MFWNDHFRRERSKPTKNIERDKKKKGNSYRYVQREEQIWQIQPF